jgi:hypothetical protein
MLGQPAKPLLNGSGGQPNGPFSASVADAGEDEHCDHSHQQGNEHPKVIFGNGRETASD